MAPGPVRRALLVAAGCLAAGRAATAADGVAAVRMEVRLVDGESGRPAAWSEGGQLLVPSPAGDAAGEVPARGGRTAPAAQDVIVPRGGLGEIRIGREVPFAGWFLRYARRAGLAEPEAEWREVEAILDVEVLAANSAGAVALALTPGLAYTQGRTRRRAVFAAERVRVAVPPGREVRVAADGALGDFYGHLLAGYDGLRRVRPVALLLRASPAAGGAAP